MSPSSAPLRARVARVLGLAPALALATFAAALAAEPASVPEPAALGGAPEPATPPSTRFT